MKGRVPFSQLGACVCALMPVFGFGGCCGDNYLDPMVTSTYALR